MKLLYMIRIRNDSFNFRVTSNWLFQRWKRACITLNTQQWLESVSFSFQSFENLSSIQNTDIKQSKNTENDQNNHIINTIFLFLLLINTPTKRDS